MMKTVNIIVLVATSLVFVQSETEDIDERLKSHFTTCADQTGFDLKSMENVTDPMEISEEALCFSKCIAEKMAVIQNGEINEGIVNALKAEGRVKEDCAAGGTKIETCQDIKLFTECFTNPFQ